MTLMGMHAVRLQKHVNDLFRAELLLERATKHLKQALGTAEGLDVLDFDKAHEIVFEKLLQIQIERDALLAMVKK